MRLRFTPRALREAKRLKSWWSANRLGAPDLFDEELDDALQRIIATPSLGIAYATGRFGVQVLRFLLTKTENHVYYAVDDDEIVVLSVWGAPRERGPKL
jgi:plasmid stabilization system protein ParE